MTGSLPVPSDDDVVAQAHYFATQLGRLADGRRDLVANGTFVSLRRRGLVTREGRLTYEGKRVLRLARSADAVEEGER